MSYDEALADRIRVLLADEAAVTETKLFGGRAFLLHGNMAIAASSQGGVIVRVDPDESGSLVGGPAQLAVMRGKSMPGWMRVAPEGLGAVGELERWVVIGTTAARSLPPKP